jgi:hypothetical protein
MPKKTLAKRLISLCFICLKKHDKNETEEYIDEQKAINDIIDAIPE